MKKRALGHCGLSTPELGLDLASASRGGLFALPDPELVELIQRGLDAGVGLFSLALHDGEGRALPLLGRALKGERERALVALRLGRDERGRRRLSPAELSEDLETARLALGEGPEIALLERGPLDVPGLAEDMKALAGSGLIKAWGATVEDLAQGRSWIGRGAQVLALRYNALEQGLAPLLDEALAAGVGVLARSPLAGGWLAGTRKGQGLLSMPEPGLSADAQAALGARAEALSFLTGGARATRAQGALQFALSHPAVSSALSGARSQAQLSDMVAACAETLDAGLRERALALR